VFILSEFSFGRTASVCFADKCTKCTVCPSDCIHETSAVWLHEYSLLLLLVVLIACYQENCCPHLMTWIVSLLEGLKEPPPDWKNFSKRNCNQ